MDGTMIETHSVAWFAADGGALPTADGAASCEVTEYLDGVPVRRTYADLDGDGEAATVPDPGVVESEDWLRGGTWDLYADGEPATTMAGLLATLDMDGLRPSELRSAVCHLLELPFWDAAPAELKQEVYAWLREPPSAPPAEAKVSPARGGGGDAASPGARSAARRRAAERIDRAEAAIDDLLTRFYERQERVVLARLKGTKARQGTRHWRPAPAEAKALNVGAVIQPARWAADIAGDAEEVVMRVWRQTADLAADDLGLASPVGLDSPIVRAAVVERVRRIMSSTEARARQVADVILDLDSTGADLDEIVTAVQGTYDQRQIWAATTAQTEATGLVNLSSLTTAQAVGLRTKEWLSSRDEKVRHTHSGVGGGDGQVAPVGLPFVIGGFPLQYPGDPLGPPQETINCRCSMLFGGGVDAQETEAAFRPQGVDERAVAWARALMHLDVPQGELPFVDTLGGLYAGEPGQEPWVEVFARVLELVGRHALLVAAAAPELAADVRAELAGALLELGVPEAEAQRILLALAARETPAT
jgi:hypothetical protein